eukprot:6470760-Amphidinium_carterae.1
MCCSPRHVDPMLDEVVLRTAGCGVVAGVVVANDCCQRVKKEEGAEGVRPELHRKGIRPKCAERTVRCGGGLWAQVVVEWKVEMYQVLRDGRAAAVLVFRILRCLRCLNERQGGVEWKVEVCQRLHDGRAAAVLVWSAGGKGGRGG